jgi:hypothetical protein
LKIHDLEKTKCKKKKKKAFHLDFGLGTLMTTWILRELNPSYNSILCMMKERTSLVTIQKICVEFFIQIDRKVHASKVQSFVDVVPIFGNKNVWWFMLCCFVSHWLWFWGHKRSQCSRWVGYSCHPALGVGDILVPSN